MEPLARDWARRREEKNVARAMAILEEKFASVNSFGPQQIVEFYNAHDKESQSMQARRGYELVRKLLSLIKKGHSDA
jgi:hypothetical protein